MSEIFLPSEVRDLPSLQFRSAGTVYDPSPAPTATQVNPDNTTTALTLTKQGSGTTTRFLVEDFTSATPDTQLEVRYATTDTAADIAEFVEYVSVLSTASSAPTAATIATAVWASATRTLSAFGFSVTVGTNNDKTGYALSSAGVQAIWDALTSALTTANSIGKRLVDFVTTLVYSAPPAAADNADAVWDELIAGHLGAGSTGAKLNSASAAGDPLLNAVPGAYAAGTAGYNIGLIDDIAADLVILGTPNITIVSPVVEVGGEEVIELVQGATYSIANGNSIDISFSGIPDTTGGSVTLTLTDEMGTIQSVTGNPYTGTLGAWVAGTVTARFEMTAAQTASIAIKLSAALEKNNLRFQVKLTLAVNGVIIPIAPKNGRVTVLTAAHA